MNIPTLGIQLHLLNPHVIWETCIQSLCEKMAKQQSSLVNFFSKISTKWRSGRFVDIFLYKSALK